MNLQVRESQVEKVRKSWEYKTGELSSKMGYIFKAVTEYPNTH